MAEEGNVHHNIWSQCENRLLSASVTLNKQYISIYKRYIFWFQKKFNENNNHLNLEIENSSFGQPVYITFKNIETYYEFQDTKYHGSKQTTKCIFKTLSLI